MSYIEPMHPVRNTVVREPSTVPGFLSARREDESFRLFEIRSVDSGCSWHSHPEYQIGYVIRGRGERVIGDGIQVIEPGEVILLGPNLPHCWRYDQEGGDSSVEALAIHFRDDFLGVDFLQKPELRDVRLLLSRACQGLQLVGPTRQLAAALLERLRHQSGLARLLTLLEFLDLTSRSHDVVTLCSPLFQPVQAELEMERLRRVCDYIKSHFQQPLDRDKAADYAHMHPSAFSRFFKKHTGQSFHDFVAEVRVGHACRLLVQPQLTITDVAHDCGFEDLSTFNRTFRRKRKMTPSDFRQRMLGYVS